MIYLVIVIVVLLAYIGWDKYETRKLHNKLINALISKNATELASIEAQDKLKPQPPSPTEIPADGMSEAEFDRHIEEELNG